MAENDILEDVFLTKSLVPKPLRPKIYKDNTNQLRGRMADHEWTSDGKIIRVDFSYDARKNIRDWRPL